ncbi:MULTISPECIES: hypothetical protein [unclassified Psychrobacillus]|uniref:hypothetical protein n=1 Tax=unclassified Psychrobacillus TaxID=2636677 RepID=UPI0030F61829
MYYDDEKFNTLIEAYPDDPVVMPRKLDGTIDYEAVQSLPKTTREEKIVYCALCNKIFGTHIFATYAKYSDDKLQNEVEIFEMLWP